MGGGRAGSIVVNGQTLNPVGSGHTGFALDSQQRASAPESIIGPDSTPVAVDQ